MTIFQKVKAAAIIRKTAKRHGVTTKQCREDMQAAIDDAWNNQDPDVQEAQLRLFPAGKPTVEAFMVSLADELKAAHIT